MPDLNLTQQLSSYVRELYKRIHKPALLYHNLSHTEKVVKHISQIAANYSLNDKEIFILSAAAWFHDTGHVIGKAEGHEERSVIIMQDYLETKIADKEIINAIKGCILATKLPHNPKTFLEDIICDADTYNLGTKEFFKTDKLIKKECELRNSMPGNNWEQKTLELLTAHKYFTTYCQKLLNKGKEKNIGIVRSLLL